MDRRERGTQDTVTALLAAFQGQQAGIWTAMPGIVSSDLLVPKQTVSVQPTIRARAQDKDGNFSWVQLPLLLDCPVIFPSGGGCSLTFPVKIGDECLVVFSSRCIDAWWQSGGIQNQPDIRMHDLSDGFAIVGPSSVPNVIAGISTTEVQLRSDDGAAFVAINPGTHGVRVVTSGNAAVTATRIDLNGQLFINGSPFLGHTHSGVQPGPGNTGGVV